MESLVVGSIILLLEKLKHLSTIVRYFFNNFNIEIERIFKVINKILEVIRVI